MDRLSRNENVYFQFKKVIQQNGVRLYVGDGTEDLNLAIEEFYNDF